MVLHKSIIIFITIIVTLLLMLMLLISGFMVTATISLSNKSDSERRADVHVSLVFEQQNITSSSCSECHKQVWCEHVIAASLYRIKHAHEVGSVVIITDLYP